MKNFFNKKGPGDRKNNSRGGYKGGNRSHNKFGNSGQAKMFSAVCDQCHSPCEVPFRPSGSQPVLCFECFRKKEGRDSRPRSGGQRFERKERFDQPSFRGAPRSNQDNVAKELKALNEKMDMIINALSEDPDEEEELNFE